MRRGRPYGLGAFAVLGVSGVAALAACTSDPLPYLHNRSDYGVFRARVGLLPEPNYLPFVAHRERIPGGGEGLVFCRWPNDAFPLTYHVGIPVIPGDVNDEFNPRVAEDYVAAVHRAFARWADMIGRPVRFSPVDAPEGATLRVHLEASRHVEHHVEVAGMLRDESSRCRVLGPGPLPDRVETEFRVSEVYLFLVDQTGLLTPGQVEQVALHEIGHALGASGEHSPLQGDLMYAAATDRRVERFSDHDRNTFRALYALSPGQVYVRLGDPRTDPVPEARRHPPRLDRELRHEDLGIAVRFPRGWQVITTPRGWVAVDGLSWDYVASIQVVSLRGSLESYLVRYGPYHLGRGRIVESEWMELDGEAARRLVVSAGGRTEETTALAWAPDEVVLVTADCRDGDYPAYRPWFRHVLLSLARAGSVADVGSGADR